MLLFHAGLYEQAFQYLNSYTSREVCFASPLSIHSLSMRDEALDREFYLQPREHWNIMMTF